MNFRNLLLSTLLVSTLCSCSQKQTLEDGDLFFINANDNDLSSAISNVTQTQQQTQFDHVAIVKVENSQIWILEAEPKNGVRKIPLTVFLGEQTTEIHHYRLKPEFAKNINKIWNRSEEMLGKPYNFTYIMNDSSFYCSDFIYHLFASDSIFTLDPMTFRDPNTGEFDQRWINFYTQNGVEIPEGLPGCNPNGLAASEKLIYIGQYIKE